MDLASDMDLRRKARIVTKDPVQVVRGWLALGWQDLRSHWGVSLIYGLGFAALGWASVALLALTGLGWMILPAIAAAMLLGPVITVGLYRISRRAQGMGGRGIAAPGQITLVSVVMMALALMWIRAATLLFAVFFGLRPFAGFLETVWTLLETREGIALLVVGTCVGGLFAALGFAISVFSFPMLVHRNIDGFSAMGLSFNATTQNLRLMILWAVVVTALVVLCVLTGLIAAVLVFPWLGYATWHAYADLFEQGPDAGPPSAKTSTSTPNQGKVTP